LLIAVVGNPTSRRSPRLVTRALALTYWRPPPHQQDGSRNEQPGLASKCARLRTSRKKIAAGAMPSVRAKLSPMISTPACRIRKPAHSGNNEQGEAVICRLFTARSVKEGPLRSCSNHVLIRSRSRNPRRKFRNRQHNREDSVHVGVLR
jgi:hypothetical protein